MLESELVRLKGQNSQLVNEVNQLSTTITGLKDELVSAEQDISFLKHEASQLQEDNRNKTCASFILMSSHIYNWFL